ncbi:protein kinase-like domain, concanavalin A-like lectin/glucanase domain protein [Tanacetum coccineum]
MGTMRCLYDLTPSYWCKTDVHSTDLTSNWLERLPARSISTWEDLTTRFLAQFFPPGRTAKLRNDILMFQQHQGESFSEAWTRFKDLLQKVPRHGIDLWLQVQIFYDNVNPAIRRTIDQSAGGKLRDKKAKESWALIKDLALYDNESWNDPRDFAKPVKAISFPHDVPNASDRRLIELENQICSGPHDTQYCMDNPEQAFVNYASSRNNDVGGEQNRNSSFLKRVHFVNIITIIRKEDKPKEPRILGLNAIRGGDRNLDTCDENTLEEKSRAPKIIVEEGESNDLGDENKTIYESLIEEMSSCSLNFNFRIEKGDPSNLKIPCMIGRTFKANAYIDLDLLMNVMSLAFYNNIRNQGYEYRGQNFVGIGRDMHVFVENMSHIIDFTILENVEANINPSLSQVVFGRPFMEITKLMLDRKQGLITFTDGIKKVTFKTPYTDSEMEDLASEGNDLLSSKVILSKDDYRRVCERPLDLESRFYKNIDKLGPMYKKEIERIDIDVSFEAGGSWTSE